MRVLLHIVALAVTVIVPAGIVVFQVTYWLKYGAWLSLSLETFGLVEWKGLAKLPLALVVFFGGGIVCWLIGRTYPEVRSSPANPCPYCGESLATSRAKQCLVCLMDWHDPDNVRRLGDQ